MIIHSLIKREGGTVVPMGNDTYNFKPDENGNHVCEVKNKAHIERFLSIKEGFIEFGKTTKAVEPEPQEPESALSDNPENWTNTQASAWAKTRGINPLNKTAIITFAEANGITDIDENTQPAVMIRYVAKKLMEDV